MMQKLTFIFKGGATLLVDVSEKEAVEILKQWADHIGDPTKQVLVISGYAEGKGDLRLVASDLSGIAREA